MLHSQENPLYPGSFVSMKKPIKINGVRKEGRATLALACILFIIVATPHKTVFKELRGRR
jgi:hypothetical protein